jgi:exodeoxyribonuclease VII large subunit
MHFDRSRALEVLIYKPTDAGYSGRVMNHTTPTPTSTGRRVFTLLQLNTSLRRSIEEATQGRSFWIKAEIASLKATRHVYLELAQHDAGARVAVMRGIIWRSALDRILQELGGDSINILKEGAEILFRACVQFHEVHGMSLVVEEIDLSFSLGALERRKRETIDLLQREGLFDLNRSLPEPMVPQRIALVCSSDSAAYADFMEHLNANDHGYRFHVCLFNSIVQGEGAARELRAALESIPVEKFDAVVLIRGGGSRLDLEAYNDLELCRAVARMPLPVYTGIGHEIDVSVVDMIARGHHKTPTAIADHLVDKCLYFETALNTTIIGIHQRVSERFSKIRETAARWVEMLHSRPAALCRSQRGDLHALMAALHREVTGRLTASHTLLAAHAGDLALLPLHKVRDVERARLRSMSETLAAAARQGMRSMYQRIQGMQEAAALLAPEKSLRRGFSITRFQGRAVADPSILAVGDVVETTYDSGRTWSVIQKIEHDSGETDV